MNINNELSKIDFDFCEVSEENVSEISERLEKFNGTISSIGYRQPIFGYELDQDSRKDYPKDDDLDIFYKFGGEIIPLNEFMVYPYDEFDGFISTSIYSGIGIIMLDSHSALLIAFS